MGLSLGEYEMFSLLQKLESSCNRFFAGGNVFSDAFKCVQNSGEVLGRAQASIKCAQETRMGSSGGREEEKEGSK